MSLPDDRPQDLREFYDPDTVDLMQWIQQNSEPEDAFSGSMQLLAGVKLCTGRTLTNHPHFEDKQLRDRTKELYQMYAKVCACKIFCGSKKKSLMGQPANQKLTKIPSGEPTRGAHQLEEVQCLLRHPRGQHLLSPSGALLHP